MKIGIVGLGYAGLPLAVAPLVVDFRGVTRGIEAPNLVRL
jgi:UDP-N-acetyl-D-mannosaminuronate dehydrogenase